MTRDDIIRMAREAGLTVGTNLSGVMLVGSPSTPGIAHIDIDEMERFAALVAAAEREACAMEADYEAARWPYAPECREPCEEIAKAIRARGEK